MTFTGHMEKQSPASLKRSGTQKQAADSSTMDMSHTRGRGHLEEEALLGLYSHDLLEKNSRECTTPNSQSSGQGATASQFKRTASEMEPNLHPQYQVW